MQNVSGTGVVGSRLVILHLRVERSVVSSAWAERWYEGHGGDGDASDLRGFGNYEIDSTTTVEVSMIYYTS